MQPGARKGLNGTHPRRVTHRALKVRSYAHFDEPLDQPTLDALVFTPVRVARHPFLPLLGYQQTSRKIDWDVFPPIATEKTREIKYAGHLDSAIYATYAADLSPLYEKLLTTKALSSCVLAYRGGIGYNVPFAKAIFTEIRDRGNCIVICLDLSKFFDTLRHDVLKTRLMEVLGCARLPSDWHAIYKRLTAFEHVDADQLKVRIGKPKGRRICGIDTFREVVRPMIQRNPLRCGIPQGTPLSGLLANIYMLEFDATLNAWLSDQGGSYRRYSDDIAVVLPKASLEDEFLKLVHSQAASIGLAINDKKTCRTEFGSNDGRLTFTGDLLQYLGFTFDGVAIRIRPESMKSFYARMKSNVRRYVGAAKRKGIPAGVIRKRVLIGRFTHWGDNKNFVQYAYRAARELESPAIRRQLRNHVAIFDRHWAKMLSKFYPILQDAGGDAQPSAGGSGSPP